jgi:hypothetical protein
MPAHLNEVEGKHIIIALSCQPGDHQFVVSIWMTAYAPTEEQLFALVLMLS